MYIRWQIARTRGDWICYDDAGQLLGQVKEVVHRGGTKRWVGSTTHGYRTEELDSPIKAKMAVEVMSSWDPPQRSTAKRRRRRIPNAPIAAPHPGSVRRPPKH